MQPPASDRGYRTTDEADREPGDRGAHDLGDEECSGSGLGQTGLTEQIDLVEVERRRHHAGSARDYREHPE